MSIKRGDLFWADLNPTKGSEQAGRRPVLVIQNDVGNEHSTITIVAPVTSRKFSREFSTAVSLPKGTSGLAMDSTVLLSQIRAIDKIRLEARIGSLSRDLMSKIDRAIKISLALH